MSSNRSWKIESFIDSLTVELDKVRDTLAIKAINKPLTYSVKDISLDLQIFPEYDGNNVKFTTAKPGQDGASKLSVQLGSITDRQVRETSKVPSKNDISLDSIEEIDEETKEDLKKIGISTYEDLKKTQNKVDLDSVSKKGKSRNYKKLADLIEKSRRGSSTPRISNISLSKNKDSIIISGENLSLNPDFLPKAKINNHPIEVSFADTQSVHLKLGNTPLSVSNELLMAFDPYAIYKLNLKNE